MLDIFKNNRIRRKKKDISNYELIDNSKNSYSINNYNNEEKRNNNRINKNENKIMKSILGKFKNDDNNNQNKESILINLYRDTKNKYSYILNKKTYKDKIKKLNNIAKSQSCTKIESNKNINENKIPFHTKIKYEKGQNNIFSNNIINSENNILSISNRSKITDLKDLDKSNLNLIRKKNKATLLKLNKKNKLTIKQNAYFLLCTSPILRLNEQIIISNIDPIIKSNL